jgi:4a-hydroxytetrahydrobiopterin dehydratase
MPRLDQPAIDAALATLDAWAHRDGALVKHITFPGFPDAVAFLVRLAFDAEAADHHPDVELRYRNLTLRYVTHSEGGITDRDVAGAAMIDALLKPASR